MLLQTIKSRNLWLWGETVIPSEETSEATKLKAEIQDWEHIKSDKENSKENNADKESNNKYQNDLQVIDAAIKSREKQLNKVQNINNGGTVNNVNYTREYTKPFKITALQSIDIQWDNPVGESYGIKTNFLQAWHNKPVNISFSGLSYIGSFGGYTVGDLAEEAKIDNQSKSWIDKGKDLINKSNNFMQSGLGEVQNFLTNTIQNVTNSDSADYAKGKYYSVIDDDIYQINQLMSSYGEGMFPNKSANVSSFWVHLVLENEPGGENGKAQYAAFIGHIKNFSYKERVDQPFLYEFTCQFVGEPTISNKVGQGSINAKKDANSIKLSLVTSDSGYSLGYGF